ncbi:hypothetical protein V1290_000018 [Bradyrhizobium sp. AZCC 1578]
MKRKPKLILLQGGKKDPAPLPFEVFFPWLFWWRWM